jgi:Carboxypeptidase regulatory-like domain
VKRVAIVVALLILGSTGFAQAGRGAIAGRVTTDQGDPAAGVTIQARDMATGKISSVVAGKTGEFRLANLPAGTCEISVPQMGLRTARYVQPNVVVEAGKTLTLNIALMPNNFGIIGDDAAFLQMYNKYANQKGPAPRTRDGHPDFSGVWLANVDPNPEPAQMLPWAVAEWTRRRDRAFEGMPTSRCLPADPTLTLPVFYKIIQTPSVLVHLFEQDPHYRQAFLDGRSHPPDLDPTWMGHTIGHWDKDTLVFDTVGLNDKSWLLQAIWLPHTEMLHIVERYTRPDLAHLNIDVTIEDPDTFIKPVERHVQWLFTPGEELFEAICAENNKFQEYSAFK